MTDREIVPGLWLKMDDRIPPGFLVFKEEGAVKRVVFVVDQQQKKPSEIYNELVAHLDGLGFAADPDQFDIIAGRAFVLDREVAWALQKGDFDRAKEYTPKAEEAYKTMMRFYNRLHEQHVEVCRDWLGDEA